MAMSEKARRESEIRAVEARQRRIDVQNARREGARARRTAQEQRGAIVRATRQPHPDHRENNVRSRQAIKEWKKEKPFRVEMQAMSRIPDNVFCSYIQARGLTEEHPFSHELVKRCAKDGTAVKAGKKYKASSKSKSVSKTRNSTQRMKKVGRKSRKTNNPGGKSALAVKLGRKSGSLVNTKNKVKGRNGSKGGVPAKGQTSENAVKGKLFSNSRTLAKDTTLPRQKQTTNRRTSPKNPSGKSTATRNNNVHTEGDPKRAKVPTGKKGAKNVRTNGKSDSNARPPKGKQSTAPSGNVTVPKPGKKPVPAQKQSATKEHPENPKNPTARGNAISAHGNGKLAAGRSQSNPTSSKTNAQTGPGKQSTTPSKLAPKNNVGGANPSKPVQKVTQGSPTVKPAAPNKPGPKTPTAKGKVTKKGGERRR